VSGERINYYNYFTEIEEHFVRRRGKHLLVSPMDWGLIAAWRDAGIPLQIALRGIDIAMDTFFSRQQRGSSKVNSLCYCHDSVMAEYDAYLESRVGESPSDTDKKVSSEERVPDENAQDEEDVSESIDYVESILGELKELPAKHPLNESATEGIRRVQDRLDAMIQSLKSGGHGDLEALERDFSMADSVLMEALIAGIPADQLDAWEAEAKKELKVYKKKLPKEMYAKIHDNFVRGKVHQTFNISEFSFFRL
jgi:hypothetical protein